MKIKSLLLACSLAFMGTAVATSAEISTRNDMVPNGCQIEVVNGIDEGITVYGKAGRTHITPFNVYPGEVHRIDVPECRRSMYLDIFLFSGFHVYDAVTSTGRIIRIVPD